jgi:hypothetical protein
MVPDGYYKQAAKKLHVKSHNVYKGRRLCGNLRAMQLSVL